MNIFWYFSSYQGDYRAPVASIKTVYTVGVGGSGGLEVTPAGQGQQEGEQEAGGHHHRHQGQGGHLLVGRGHPLLISEMVTVRRGTLQSPRKICQH